MQFCPYLPVMILKKYTYTFYKASKNFHAYFRVFRDNSFYQLSEWIQRKYLAFNVAHIKIHNRIIGSFIPQQLAMLRNFQLLQFLYWKDTLKYSRVYWKAQILETDVSQLIVFLCFVCLYSWGHFICKVILKA